MGYRILLADDEEALRFLLTETLEDEGYQLTEAGDGQQAIELLMKQEYDLLILDYMMPEKTGVEVCEWVRQSKTANRETPVLLLTAKAQQTDRDQAMLAGVTAYMTKPFSPMQLVTIVEGLLEK